MVFAFVDIVLFWQLKKGDSMYYVVVEVVNNERAFNRFVGKEFADAELVAKNRLKPGSNLYIEQWYDGADSYVQMWEID